MACDNFEQLKKRLTNLGNTLQDTLRLTLEDTMAEFTDQVTVPRETVLTSEGLGKRWWCHVEGKSMSLGKHRCVEK